MQIILAIILSLITVLLALGGYAFYRGFGALKDIQTFLDEEVRDNEPIPAPIILNTAEMALAIRDLKKVTGDLPKKILRTFEGSANVSKGTIAEWAAYHKLTSCYDIVIPFNTVFDFMCVKFPEDGIPGSIDFVDVKSGRAQLSKEQRRLRDLIKTRQIDFKTVRIKVDS